MYELEKLLATWRKAGLVSVEYIKKQLRMSKQSVLVKVDEEQNFKVVLNEKVPGLTLLLASWLSWQELAKFLLHLGNHGSHSKILIKILVRFYLFQDRILLRWTKF